MGSLTSTPKTPRRQVVSTPVFVSQPQSQPVRSQPIETPEPTQEISNKSKEREKTLLARKRSRFGTIVTGFRGLLSEINSNARKTLLGE